MFRSKLNIRVLFCLSILSLLYFAVVKSDCVLRYPDNAETAPIYRKIFGKYFLDLPYTKSDIILEDGENVRARCQGMFRFYGPFEEYQSQAMISLKCVDSGLYYDGDLLEHNLFECRKLNWNIYDNKNEREWCKTNPGLAALLLAAKSVYYHHILAEICFDLNDWSLQTITYNATFPTENVEMLRDARKTKLHTVLADSSSPLGDNLWNIKSTNKLILTDLDLKAQITEMSQRNSWLHLANYELSSIVQGKSYENDFKEYSNILNTIWWRNLRLGNWKRFMDTLENYAYNNSFQLYTGTSGVVRKPTDNVADTTADLTIKFGFQDKPIPAYIWTYLTSIDKTNKDFIIVGYNSPYAEFFSRMEIVFCPDICNEIPWLNEISKTFKFSTAGIMFCCSPESIQDSNLLDGFPMEVLNSRMESMTKQRNNTVNNIMLSLFNTTNTTEETPIPTIGI